MTGSESGEPNDRASSDGNPPPSDSRPSSGFTSQGPLEHALLLADIISLDAAWEPFLPGVERHWLYCATAEGPAAALLRFHPGACVPLHEHRGYEHIFVLRGEQADENGTASAGSLLVHPPGTRHRVVSATGCLVLAIYEKPVRFLEPWSDRHERD